MNMKDIIVVIIVTAIISLFFFGMVVSIEYGKSEIIKSYEKFGVIKDFEIEDSGFLNPDNCIIEFENGIKMASSNICSSLITGETIYKDKYGGYHVGK